jgi:hypothetical protein
MVGHEGDLIETQLQKPLTKFHERALGEIAASIEIALVPGPRGGRAG